MISLITVLLQLSEQVVVGETRRYTGDASSYQYYEWVKNLTIPAVDVTDTSSYQCTVQIGGLSNYAVYNFTVVSKLSFVVANY